MSSITGEIGYKVGAASNLMPMQTRLFVGGVAGTFTGAVTINPSPLAAGLVINGANNQFAAVINGGPTGGQSFGLDIVGGNSAADIMFQVRATGTNVMFKCAADGSAQMGMNSAGSAALSVSGGVGGAIMKQGSGAFNIEDTNGTLYFVFGANGLAIQNIAGVGTQIFNVYEKSSNANALFSVCRAASILGTSTQFAWGTGTHYPILQIAGMGALFGTATESVVLTGGGLFYSGTNFVYGSPGTGVVMALGTGSFTVSCVSTSGTATSTGTVTTVFSIGGTVTSNKIQGYGPNAAGLIDMTPDTGTFTGTYGGLTAAVTAVAYWSRQGNNVTVQIPFGSGSKAGAAGTLTFAPVPTAIQPQRAQVCQLVNVSSGGTNVIGGGQVAVTNNATMTIFQGAGGNGFAGTAAAVVGISGQWLPITYPINP